MTVLELLVVLAISILVTGLVASGLRPAFDAKTSSFEEIAAFVTAARLDAMRSGAADVLVIGADAMTYRGKSLRWDASTTSVSIGEGGEDNLRVVVYADGSVSGPAMEVTEAGVAKAVPAPLRPSSLHRSSD
jgi:Tfp pilus assembly protein FimT